VGDVSVDTSQAATALIFGSRWLQLPLYIGLIVAQCVYVVLFLKELWHLIAHSFDFSEQQIMLVVLGLIDVVMISNLLVMVIVGGYETFVSRLNLNGHPDEPEWLSHVNASVLKIKLAMAIIGISSIHLLRTFIAAGTLGEPWHSQPGNDDIRYLRSSTWPSAKLHFKLSEGDKTLSEGEDSIADMNYQLTVHSDNGDRLFYDKRMLQTWFDKRFLSSDKP
jgi:uncharacterized protein (TIGR00645 family)